MAGPADPRHRSELELTWLILHRFSMPVRIGWLVARQPAMEVEARGWEEGALDSHEKNEKEKKNENKKHLERENVAGKCGKHAVTTLDTWGS